jgi:GT2 family glycosyltransferase
MPELAFVMSPRQNWFFREMVDAIRFELRAQGVASSLHEEFPEPTPNRIFVLVPPHEFARLEGAEAMPAPELLARTVFICAEQPGTIHFDEDTELGRGAGAVFDINPCSVDLFRAAGVPARHFALGYTKHWDHFDPTRNRDIDVLFMGAASPRRLRYLSSFGSTLARWNCHLRISDNSAPNVGQSSSFAAEEKWDLLSRAKLLINLHQGTAPYFEWLRAVDAIHCGAVLVSEHSTHFAPLREGRHVFFGGPGSLAYLTDTLLRDERRLEEAREESYGFLRNSMPLAASVAELVGAARNLLGRPIPAGDPRGRRQPVHFDQAPPFPSPAGPNDDSTILRAGLKDTRLDLLAIRRQLGRIEATLASPDLQPPPLVERVGSTEAWEASRNSTVTVVTALYNHRDLIAGALDSLIAGVFTAYEIVVVDDGSTDGSGEVVRSWMEQHENIPLQLLRHPVNRGLGAARNTAVDFARGPYCFVLDADNLLYPRCLEALVGTLKTDPEATFAYPILEVFGMVDAYIAAGGSPLVSYLGWDPRRLRTGNYIDALSLIRTDALRRLGGYATDRRLFGWEDFDLWCRVAEAGGRGLLVPQILARYRASANSMRTLSDLYGADGMAAVAERNPKLMSNAFS